ncbi:mitochondrial fission ELM1 family protein [Jiella marina]|uniref:mitochondrial fission ELM1 family protein n=1 Tax=Jiella sp. LLJ827 TaxID=2917712 RepID=UPI002101CFD6|nr:mitochondrial fission ELM1 family protein [Jiella sp. LLJ827]MCQ0990151.1 mitochondrial fission ELM1 family protein [Jiella sp. LLJ827]
MTGRSEAPAPLRVWTVSEAKAGTLTQCLGVARLLDPDPTIVTMRRRFQWWRPKLDFLPKLFSRGPPDIIISCGGKAQSHAMVIAACCRRRPFMVHLARPAPQFERRFDMAFASRHDLRDVGHEHPRFHAMVGVPHQIHADAISARRAEARRCFVPQGEPTVALLVGGPNKAYDFDQPTVDRLSATVFDLAEKGFRVLVSTSRRSPPSLQENISALRHDRVFVWNRQGENPYRDFLAAADYFIITADSVTMTCEALTTGKPTFTFALRHRPDGRYLQKFEWMHNDMQNTLGLTRNFEGELYDYAYEPLDETKRIGAMVQAEYAHRTKKKRR